MFLFGVVHAKVFSNKEMIQMKTYLPEGAVYLFLAVAVITTVLLGFFN